jgi:hypothetical protein
MELLGNCKTYSVTLEQTSEETWPTLYPDVNYKMIQPQYEIINNEDKLCCMHSNQKKIIWRNINVKISACVDP